MAGAAGAERGSAVGLGRSSGVGFATGGSTIDGAGPGVGWALGAGAEGRRTSREEGISGATGPCAGWEVRSAGAGGSRKSRSEPPPSCVRAMVGAPIARKANAVEKEEKTARMVVKGLCFSG